MEPTRSVTIPAYHCNDFLPLCLQPVLPLRLPANAKRAVNTLRGT